MFIGLATFFCVWFPHLSEAAKDFGCDSVYQCMLCKYAVMGLLYINIYIYIYIYFTK